MKVKFVDVASEYFNQSKNILFGYRQFYKEQKDSYDDIFSTDPTRFNPSELHFRTYDLHSSVT